MMRLGALLTFAVAMLTYAAPTFAASDSVHHSATVRIAPERARLKVEDTLAVKSGGEITLMLSAAFTVDALTVNGQPATVQRDSDRLGEGLRGDLGGQRRVEVGVQVDGGDHAAR